MSSLSFLYLSCKFSYSLSLSNSSFCLNSSINFSLNCFSFKSGKFIGKFKPEETESIGEPDIVFTEDGMRGSGCGVLVSGCISVLVLG